MNLITTDRATLSSGGTEPGALREITPRDFEQICQIAYSYAGLDLRKKEQLVATRLGKKLRDLQIPTFAEYCRRLSEDRTGESLAQMIDALTTNHTSFFREPAHFEFLRQRILPELKSRSRITVWSAACSTGEEPYSIAFALLNQLGWDRRGQIRILATDISTRVLAQARRGAYPAERFAGVPEAELRPYLLKGTGASEGWFLVKEAVRAMVDFERTNLMEDQSRFGPFPLIFCRNVMIYFDRPTQQGVVKRLCERLEPGGYLFIGHAESLNGIEHPLEYIRPATYRKPMAAR
jgi:chemotaxis protein methyltransferase CheR